MQDIESRKKALKSVVKSWIKLQDTAKRGLNKNENSIKNSRDTASPTIYWQFCAFNISTRNQA
jgi:hypothetical protein